MQSQSKPAAGEPVQEAESGRAQSRATSYDVARLAGVSQSAVSRAFRAGGSVSKATRARVELAARELGYSPSQIARSLITQRSRMIGVVMTELTARNNPDVLRFLSDEIQAGGNRMLLCTVPQDQQAAAAASDLLAFHVDGIVSSALLPRETLEAAGRQGVPVVLYNRAPMSGLASSVACDHPLAMHMLADHLVAGGIGRAAFIAGPEAAPVSNDRLRGLRQAFAERGLALESVLHSDYSYDGGRSVALEHFGRKGRTGAGPAGSTYAGCPDTIICANDAMALGVMDACRFELGLRVPEDVAVAGFDDVAQAAWPSYALTTLRQPLLRMTQVSVRLLMEQLAGAAAGGERRLLPAELKVRSSTRRPAAA